MKEIIHIKVGKITLQKNARAKRIILKVKPKKGVWVTLPQRASYQAAEQLVEQHLDWILLQQKKHTKRYLNLDTCLTVRTKQIRLTPTLANRAKIEASEHLILLHIPQKWQLNTPEIQHWLQDQLIEILRHEAKKYLVGRTRFLAQQKGISINRVTIKNIRSRWGSCSSKSNINLSLFLMLLSDELMDYVILHELAHIRHQNHSQAFWNHLEDLLPNSKALDRQMRGVELPF